MNIPQLARRTVGLSGAELESLINVAAMKALAGGYLRIHNAHILEALDRIQMGSRNARSNNKDVERLTLYRLDLTLLSIDYMNVVMQLCPFLHLVLCRLIRLL